MDSILLLCLSFQTFLLLILLSLMNCAVHQVLRILLKIILVTATCIVYFSIATLRSNRLDVFDRNRYFNWLSFSAGLRLEKLRKHFNAKISKFYSQNKVIFLALSQRTSWVIPPPSSILRPLAPFRCRCFFFFLLSAFFPFSFSFLICSFLASSRPLLSCSLIRFNSLQFYFCLPLSCYCIYKLLSKLNAMQPIYLL